MAMKFKVLLMEALGVFALCYIGGLSCCMIEAVGTQIGAANLPNGALAHMLALMVMIYIGAATSGKIISNTY